MLSFLRIVKFALQDIGRNFSLSFMTVLILVLMLLSINTLVAVHVLTEKAVSSVKEQLSVSIHFRQDVKDEQVTEVQSFINSFPAVTSVEFLNRDEVLQQFKDIHKENPDILSSLNELGDNPFGPTMIITTREPSDYEKVITAISVPEYEGIIESKTFQDTQKAIDRIGSITAQVQKFVFVLTGLFGIISFLVIFNTIRVAIYTQRIEISIKKLVGASNWFVRGPYLIEALVFTFLSVILTFVIMYFVVQFIDPFVSVVFSSEKFLTNYFLSHILVLAGAEFGIVLLLTFVTSFLAMRRYLRV
ncbi:MAG: hypothetical protein A3J66_03645 [Candidatus Magasanikbacteria bacterium RIFCSPHIGHO2_02_FULL_47_14]|uniref:Cell division protein FtsX n=1 Tax=Candidatus Magasanikbacteria bacterium RIFCSPHIGHO2_02_FULL_47_14 TaxID=1798680 RepID=A0A1F6M799_9BACT|nr:MAG: hypothetical protein A3J66_03645 [Candidatus Magasanikbacteria bacterium RIFCSPHIGHO2_02_FULL_47_14]